MITSSEKRIVRRASARRRRGGALAALGAFALIAACSGSQGPAFSNLGSSPDGATGGGGPPPAAEGGTPSDEAGTIFSVGDGGGSVSCKGGLYEGTFKGTYTSSLTLIGLPVPVTGNLSMTLTETQSGSEFPIFAIQNGVISGLVYGIYPFFCTMVGTLDCNAQKLVGGAVSCVYCVGKTTGDLADGGTCSVGGHFEGPLNANYDSASASFVDGTWNGSEGTPGADAASETVNEAGVYVGPGNYGGSGTWTAAFDDGDQ